MWRFQTMVHTCIWVVLCWSCGQAPPSVSQKNEVSEDHHTLVLITLDTTRADRLGFGGGPATPILDDLAAKSLVFTRAYTTAPTTLPSHVSMMTGQYPYQHKIHENARYLDGTIPVLAELLGEKGFQTAGFVSGYPLAAVFGLARGFDHYSEPAEGQAERIAAHTTDAAIEYLQKAQSSKLFLWVHYYDPHAPYRAPEPFHSQAKDAYQAEIEYLDRELGRLITQLNLYAADRPLHVLVVADHGEGLGEGGEAQHGLLLSEGVMKVPMLLMGPGVQAGKQTQPISTRKVHHMMLDLADHSFDANAYTEPVVMGEAMKPFLQYGWAPQTLAVTQQLKIVRDTELHVFSASADPNSAQNLFGSQAVPEEALTALKDYQLPLAKVTNAQLSEEDLVRLASLGYSASQGMSVLREDMQAPRDMIQLVPLLDQASRAFVNNQYPQAVTAFQAVIAKDPNNLMAHLRLAVAHSQLNQKALAEQHFAKAGILSPESLDVRHYLGMHYLRNQQLEKAAEALEWVLNKQPGRLTTLRALANLRQQQGLIAQAAKLWEQVGESSGDHAAFLQAANFFMQLRDSASAERNFAQAANNDGFEQHLEWGVCLLDLRRLDEAAIQLEQVPDHHQGYGMALFKRAQVGALRKDADVNVWVQKIVALNNPQLLELLKRDGLLRPFL